MNQPPPFGANPSQHAMTQQEIITHHGVYHMSDLNQHRYDQSAHMMAQTGPAQPAFVPGTFTSDVIYQEGNANQFSQYPPSHQQYFQAQPYSENQVISYVPGMPIHPSDVNFEFFQSVPPPSLLQDASADGHTAKNDTSLSSKWGRGGRGRSGYSHREQKKLEADNYLVESQEFHSSSQRERPKQEYSNSNFNIRGRSRGRGRFQPSFNHRDVKYGNGDGNHLNNTSYHQKQYDNGSQHDRKWQGYSQGSKREQYQVPSHQDEAYFDHNARHHRRNDFPVPNSSNSRGSYNNNRGPGKRGKNMQEHYNNENTQLSTLYGKKTYHDNGSNQDVSSRVSKGKRDDNNADMHDSYSSKEKSLATMQGVASVYAKKKIGSKGPPRDPVAPMSSADKDESQRGKMKLIVLFGLYFKLN